MNFITSEFGFEINCQHVLAVLAVLAVLGIIAGGRRFVVDHGNTQAAP